MHLAARDKWGDNTDVTGQKIKESNEYEADYSTTALNRDALFRQEGLNDNYDLDEEDVYVEIDDESPEMVRKELQVWIQGAKASGL